MLRPAQRRPGAGLRARPARPSRSSSAPLDELRERAAARVTQLHDAGVADARLYGRDPDDGVGGDGAFFLLLDEPEVYGLPPDPVVTTRDLPAMWRRVGAAAAALAAGAAAAFAVAALGGRRRRAEVTGAGPARRAPGPGRHAGDGHQPGTEPGAADGGRAARREGTGRRAEQPMVPPAEFTSYYGRPILNAPVWAAAGHPRLPVPGRAGRRVLAAGRRGQLTGRPALARASKAAAAGAVCLGLAGAGPRPWPARPVRQHAAGVQADLADERWLMDPVRLRPGRGCRRGLRSPAGCRGPARRPPRAPGCSDPGRCLRRGR